MFDSKTNNGKINPSDTVADAWNKVKNDGSTFQIRFKNGDIAYMLSQSRYDNIMKEIDSLKKDKARLESNIKDYKEAVEKCETVFGDLKLKLRDKEETEEF